MNCNDLRVIKTQKNIEDTLVKLLKQKPFTVISVQDIIEEALINRSTFYRHYQDKYQLVDSMNKRIYLVAKASIEERFLCKTAEELMDCVKQLYEDLLDKKDTILALFSIHTENLHLYDDMHSLLHHFFAQFYTQKHDVKDNMGDYYATIYASLVMTTINWCLLNETGYDNLVKNSDFFLKLAELF